MIFSSGTHVHLNLTKIVYYGTRFLHYSATTRITAVAVTWNTLFKHQMTIQANCVVLFRLVVVVLSVHYGFKWDIYPYSSALPHCNNNAFCHNTKELTRGYDLKPKNNIQQSSNRVYISRTLGTNLQTTHLVWSQIHQQTKQRLIPKVNGLTHSGRVMHVCVKNHYWFK